jgi:hypothetical protein
MNQWALGQKSFFGLVASFVVFVVFFILYFKTLKKLNYSYWTFSFFIGSYSILGMLSNIGDGGLIRLFYLNFLVFILCLYSAYLISSPLYYPRVSWWEWDFRYRGDLSAKVKTDTLNIPARLSDLRRGAGCIVTFKEIPIGSLLTIEDIEEFSQGSLQAEVVSFREDCAGRGITHGVRFKFTNPESKKSFQELVKSWKEHHKAKVKSKFEC